MKRISPPPARSGRLLPDGQDMPIRCHTYPDFEIASRGSYLIRSLRVTWRQPVVSTLAVFVEERGQAVGVGRGPTRNCISQGRAISGGPAMRLLGLRGDQTATCRLMFLGMGRQRSKTNLRISQMLNLERLP